MIACFLNNISAKYYTNPSMLSRVIAKNVGDVFLRHSVHVQCAVKYVQGPQFLHQKHSKFCMEFCQIPVAYSTT